MIDNIKKTMYQALEELFVNAAIDEMTGDTTAYKEKVKTISRIAAILGVDTEIITVTINMKTGKSVIDVVSPK